MTELLIKQSEAIEKLSSLCKELINELAQYKEIEKEESRYKDIMQEGNDYE